MLRWFDPASRASMGIGVQQRALSRGIRSTCSWQGWSGLGFCSRRRPCWASSPEEGRGCYCHCCWQDWLWYPTKARGSVKPMQANAVNFLSVSLRRSTGPESEDEASATAPSSALAAGRGKLDKTSVTQRTARSSKETRREARSQCHGLVCEQLLRSGGVAALQRAARACKQVSDWMRAFSRSCVFCSCALLVLVD